jgi:hypothetical protein
MFRSLSLKGMLAICALYALGAFAIQTLEGNLDLGALGPLFADGNPDTLVPQKGDSEFQVQIRLYKFGFLVSIFGAMLLFQMVQGLLPGVIGVLLIKAGARRFGTMSYGDFALGGLLFGVAVGAFALLQGWIVHGRTAIFIMALATVCAVVYRFIAGPRDSAGSRLAASRAP